MPMVVKGKRRYKRATADRVLAEVIGRIETINEDDHYAFQVTALRLFGSMLTDDTEVGDIDLAVHLGPRYEDKKCQVDLWFDRGGGENMCRPINEVLIAIKSRSPLVSLHDWNEPDTLETPSRVIWPPARD